MCWVKEKPKHVQVPFQFADVDGLQVQIAIESCWNTASVCIQARGKFGLRTKSVLVHEATFLEEAERKVLSVALLQWQRKAESDVAAAALGVGIAETRLLHASSRCNKVTL